MTQPQLFPNPFRARSAAPQASAELALTLLGPSAAMSQLWSQIRRLAPHVRTLLLTGEADCGQEAIARLLLDLSSAPRRSFVKITAADAESRLLRSAGLASLPAEAVLYIPDVDRFSLAAAEGLLRLIRMRRSRPFTVVAAASSDLRTLASAGRFPTELADSLTAIRLQVPCLKQRTEDLPMLLGQLLTVRALEAGVPTPQIGEDLHRAAMEYSWPGNLRELSRVASSLLQTADDSRPLTASALHDAITHQQISSEADAGPVRMVSLEIIMQEHVAAVLRACHGNKLRAAEVLGISRSTLYRTLDAATAHGTPMSLAS